MGYSYELNNFLSDTYPSWTHCPIVYVFGVQPTKRKTKLTVSQRQMNLAGAGMKKESFHLGFFSKLIALNLGERWQHRWPSHLSGLPSADTHMMSVGILGSVIWISYINGAGYFVLPSSTHSLLLPSFSYLLAEALVELNCILCSAPVLLPCLFLAC